MVIALTITGCRSGPALRPNRPQRRRCSLPISGRPSWRLFTRWTWRRTTKILPIHCRYLMGNALSGDDERLQLLIERWPTLSKEIQQQIMLLLLEG